jgi:hypothetical protein
MQYCISQKKFLWKEHKYLKFQLDLPW